MSGSVAPLNGLRPDIALQAGQGVAKLENPLTTLGQFAGVQNALTQNRALEAGIRQTETGTAGMAQDQALKRLGVAQQAAGALLLEHPDGIPATALTSTVAQLLGMGIFKREEVGPMLQNVPMGDSPQEVAERTAWARRFNVQALGALEQAARSRGVPTTLNTGGEQVPGLMSERGFVPQGAGFTNTMPPTSAADIVDVPVIGPDGKPTGATEKVTRAEAARRGGLGGTVAPGIFDNGGRMPAPATAPQPAASSPPVAAPTASPATPQPAPVAPVAPRPTGSLGRTQTQAEVASQGVGVKQGEELTNFAKNIGAQRAMLGEMDSLLDRVKTGKKQDQLLVIRQYVQSLAPDRVKAIFGVDADSVKGIADAELLKKLFTQFGTQAAGAAGLNTDQARNIVLGGNPNFDLSTLGNKQIVGLFRGTLDYMEALANGWRDSPQYETGDFAKFINEWNKKSDPRMFQWNYMDRDAREKMLKADPALAAKIRAARGAQ